MGGGLMQLVAYGAQDIYLTGNPQITFFKVVYRRHTNFAMEAVEQTMNGSAAYGGKAVATVSRNGDLVGRMYVEHNVTLTNGEAVDTVSNYGHALLREVTCEIGGQEIDKQTGRWMQIWSDLTEFNPTGASATCAVATKPFGESGTLFQRMTGTGKGEDGGTAAASTTRIFVPLQFWFNRNPGLALPLIALQYHEVKVKVTLGNAAAGGDTSCALNADYIYLDTDERRRFAQVSHEYLIEQVQHTTGSSLSSDLNFNHPVKELVWTGAVSDVGTRTVLTATSKFKLVLNGHDRFAERPMEYFTQTQVWQHHTGTPVGTVATLIDDQAGSTGNACANEVAVYSFALKPEEHQPSGTCNFSRIDNAQLKQTSAALPSDGFNIYAVNYNVLRVMSGMGGLAYSN